LRNDREVVLDAIKENSNAYKYIFSEKLKNRINKKK